MVSEEGALVKHLGKESFAQRMSPTEEDLPHKVSLGSLVLLCD